MLKKCQTHTKTGNILKLWTGSNRLL